MKTMMSGNKWRGWYCSAIGPAHIKNSIPNQDHSRLYISKNILVGVVCDGLGSKKYSHIGSKALTKSAIQISKIFDFSKDIRLFQPLLKAMWDINKAPYNDDETGSTLLLTILTNNKFFIGRVGDGAIVVIGKNNIIIEENKLAFVNMTYSFGNKIQIQWHIIPEDDVQGIIMLTDGISEDIKRDSLINFAKEMLNTYKNKKISAITNQVNKWLKNWPARGHSDDKSILVFMRK